MGQGKDANRRAYERFALDLEVRVYAADDPQRLLDDSLLCDVSGSGASFLSREPGHYHIGQSLHLVIVLPGTDRLDARMEGQAEVARIGGTDADGRALIGVTMDEALDFRRSSVSGQGEGA